MRKFTFLMTLIFLLAGCSGTQSDGEKLTIFGRLSQMLQTGSTEQIIAHKLYTDGLFINVRGEILQKYPGEFNVTITDRETGQLRDDLTVSITLCTLVDREDDFVVESLESCDKSLPLYIHNIEFAPQDGVYQSETFTWDVDGYWLTELVVDDGTAEPATFAFESEASPPKPPSSNAFELINLSLPFIVITVFLLAMRRLRKQITQLPAGSVME